MDAPFVGISSAGANRFNLTFPGISGEYPLITERTEYGVKVKEMLGTAGWDGILNDKLSDIDEHACRHVCVILPSIGECPCSHRASFHVEG